MGKKISPEQLVNYLKSNEDDVADSFGVSIDDLVPALHLISAATALLSACQLAYQELTEWNEGHEASEAQLELRGALTLAEGRRG